MSLHRSLGRNIHSYEGPHPDEEIGVLLLNPESEVTKANFMFKLAIILRGSDAYGAIRRGIGSTLGRNDEPIEPGAYDIRSRSINGSFSFTYPYTIH